MHCAKTQPPSFLAEAFLGLVNSVTVTYTEAAQPREKPPRPSVSSPSPSAPRYVHTSWARLPAFHIYPFPCLPAGAQRRPSSASPTAGTASAKVQRGKGLPEDHTAGRSFPAAQICPPSSENLRLLPGAPQPPRAGPFPPHRLKLAKITARSQGHKLGERVGGTYPDLCCPLGCPALERWEASWKKGARRGVPSWRSGERIRLGTMRFWVRSLPLLSGLRIWGCCELWCRSQTRLRSRTAVAVA